ncbi:hypothetical protein [Methanosalsum natronophilum]|uniref:hypothetical protein n=1 Tax=Methanosalsum natronophilum TaxID=768733 RepID=UPI0021692564|nr:hypothetical protein [Methanosalsum natronophilum]MCS3924660.1 hypothetical protein [Methanosalsum natronophilum]
MKGEKKNSIVGRQKYQSTLKRNRQISKINLVIIGSALVIYYAGYEEFASPLLWLGIILIIYTLGSNLMIRHKINQLK